MESVQSWVSKNKLITIGGLWASGIGASLVAHSRTNSPMKPSLRLIHARLHAQALTLGVLAGAAAYHYYEKRARHPNTHIIEETPALPPPSMAQVAEWELLTPF
ncbi:uncharacterized protein LOC130731588 [Lotus japonicus]|uniref:HIG1 domain-containing protein n=1 Tax=Lotus japonicus TaxID=34305 RepID=I3S213_LOTJA|nr:uncharacterized protein LOC130731588 [Lotus japonicus]AFK34305.1 unknown [Lotus japonicus]